MNDKNAINDTIEKLIAAQAERIENFAAMSREDQLRTGYEKALEHNPDLLFADFIAEVVAQEREQCGYLKRLPEAVVQGITFDREIFKDVKRVLDLAAKSKYVLIPAAVWSDIIGNEVYTNLFDPVTSEDLLTSGKLGSMVGCEFYSALFASPERFKAVPESEHVIFVIHEQFRKYFDPETKRFIVDGDPTDEELERQAEEDRFDLENCPFIQLLPHALENGVLTHVDIFNGKHKKQLDKLLESSQYVLIPNKAWAHIIGSNEFAEKLDPITDYSLALNGDLGVLSGCRLYTDGFLKPYLKDRSEEARTRVIFVPRETE